MTFFGQRRWKPDTHPHESPAIMTGADGARRRIGRGGALLALGGGLADWLGPSPERTWASRGSRLDTDGDHAGRRRGRGADRLADVRHPAHPEVAPTTSRR